MKQSLINRIALCDKCKKAFIINQEGDETTCDVCLDTEEQEYVKELIREGVIEYGGD